MPDGWTVAACMLAFVCGIWFAVEADDAMQRKRVATGIIFIDNVPYSVRPLSREAQ